MAVTQKPLVHLNGSSKQFLLETYQVAGEQLYKLKNPPAWQRFE